MKTIIYLLAILFTPLLLSASSKNQTSIEIPEIAASPKLIRSLIKKFLAPAKNKFSKSYNKKILDSLKKNNYKIRIGSQDKGCTITKNKITFYFRSTNKNSIVYVLGTFNKWQLFEPVWQLKYDDLNSIFAKSFSFEQRQLTKKFPYDLAFIFYVDGDYVFR